MGWAGLGWGGGHLYWLDPGEGWGWGVNHLCELGQTEKIICFGYVRGVNCLFILVTYIGQDRWGGGSHLYWLE